MAGKLPRMLVALSLAAFIGLVGCDDDDGTGNGGNAPAAATAVGALATGDSLIVTWTPGANTSSFRIEARTATDTTTQTLASATADSALFTGLADGDYSAVVIAVNSAGETPATGFNVTVNSAVRRLRAQILQNMTLTNDIVWVLRGAVFVGQDVGADGNAANGVAVTLTIEPGTTILGDTIRPSDARGNFIVISRGSQIIADANRSVAGNQNVKPDPDSVIVFTSGQPRGSRARGDWGGLVINGRAPINLALEAEGEGESGLYGGDVPNDNSGILRGVRVEFAGDRATTSDELNGIAFQAVGSATTVSFVQIHYNFDDGTEPFGGTVSQTHVVTTGIADDSFDGTDGYQGFMQFLIAQQRGDAAGNGFEISTSGDDPAADDPPSSAVIANATMVGAGVDLGSGEIFGASGGAGSGQTGALLREGSHYRIYNTIVTGFGESGFDVEGATTALNADCRLQIGCSAGEAADPLQTISVEGSILWSNVDVGGGAGNFADASDDGYDAGENQTFFETAAFNNMLADPLLPDAAFDIGTQAAPPDFIPTGIPGGYTPFDLSMVNMSGLVLPGDGRMLEETDYPGAVDPATGSVADAWYSGWTVWAVDGSDSRPGLADL